MNEYIKALKDFRKVVQSLFPNIIKKRQALQNAIDGMKLLNAKIDSTIRNSNKKRNKNLRIPNDHPQPF